MRRSRVAAERYAHTAETLCTWLLRLRLYRVLARRWKTPVGELDIVARRGPVLAFIEVKARAVAGDAAEAVTLHQRRRIARAASHFRAKHPSLAHLDARFDVMIVVPGRWPRHLKGAWIDGMEAKPA